jgi:hypothetical protein
LSIKRKALSFATSVVLLATLLATTAGVVSANTNSLLQTTGAGCTPACGTQVAGTGSILSINGTAAPTNVAPQSGAEVMFQASTGSTIVGSSGSFVYHASATVTGTPPVSYLANTATLPAGAAVTATGTVLLTATAAGTYTITEYVWSTTLLTWLPDGNTYSYTFVSAASLQVSVANSSAGTFVSCAPSTTSVTSGAASPTNTVVAHLCVIVKDGNGNLVGNASVTGTITPVGLAQVGAVTGQSYTATTGTVGAALGVADVTILSSGLPGNATITVNVTYLGVTTALTSVTFTFTGTPNTLAIQNYNAYTGVGGVLVQNAFLVKATDASSNTTELAFATAGLTLTSTPAGLVFSAGAGTSTHPRTIAVTCPAGTTEVAYKVNATLTSPSLTTATPAVFYCNVGKATKITITPTATAIPAGGSTTIDVKATDAAGNPIADGTTILGVASAGALLGDGTAGTSGAVTLGGVASFFYFAQNTTGPVTVSFLEGAVSGVSAQSTIVVGTVLINGTNASHLGLSHSGVFTTATKIQVRGKYVTWKLSFGTVNSGKSAAIWIATKNSAGVWSAFTKLTGRVVDSAGNAYFSWRSFSARWISIKGIAGNTGTPARQARWR